jgi:glyoxylate/hydroxypyruvate reductase A
MNNSGKVMTSVIIPFVSSLNAQEEQDWVSALSSALPSESIKPFSTLSKQQKQAAEIAIIANPNPDDLKQLPNLVWVHSVWAGVEKLLQGNATPNYSIVRLIDPELSRTMSEAVLAWSLYLHRNMPDYRMQQAKAVWNPLPYVPAPERKIGVLGLGELGQASAKLLKNFGFSVIGWSRSAKDIAGVECLNGQDGLDDLLSQSDILVCLLPQTPETEGLLGHENLAKLKPGAQLINFARGKIVDEDALLHELNVGRIHHAVLDVFQYEPLPRSHTFWTHPNITVLPHISAPTTVESAVSIVAQNIRNYRHLNMLPATVDVQLGY